MKLTMMKSAILRITLLAGLHVTASAQSYAYTRIGQKNDVTTTTSAGIAMRARHRLGRSFSLLCQKVNGGDFLILRARGSDDYNSYVNGLCKLNSGATLVIPDRKAAQNPAVADIIRHAAVLFIAGGDQARYINFWRGTPVEEAINADIAAGKAIGGTSAGLAVEGEFVYGALGDKPDDEDLASADVLSDPYAARVTVVRDFLKVPRLRGILTDSHFAKRDRMGRSLVFLARIMQDGWSKQPREIAIDEKSAVLVEADGRATVVGSGRGAYFLRPTQAPEICQPKTPLIFATLRFIRFQPEARSTSPPGPALAGSAIHYRSSAHDSLDAEGRRDLLMLHRSLYLRACSTS